ncbi:hypothetical protein ACFC1R_06450 [Kitasatospora sp. NPDC056138]|uniref:hypothetical protein n=1 Tax=Kitasatospora sp. NPDC056138 TaxID=3345724 RepID=UPI0035DD774F
MADTPLGPDAHYLLATADLYGWDVAREPDSGMRLSLLDWTLQVVLTPDGHFRLGRASGPETTEKDLDLREALDVLEKHGNPTPPETDSADPRG